MQYVEQTFCLYGGHNSIIKLDRGHAILNTQGTSLPSICFYLVLNEQTRKKQNESLHLKVEMTRSGNLLARHKNHRQNHKAALNENLPPFRIDSSFVVQFNKS